MDPKLDEDITCKLFLTFQSNLSSFLPFLLFLHVVGNRASEPLASCGSKQFTCSLTFVELLEMLYLKLPDTH